MRVCHLCAEECSKAPGITKLLIHPAILGPARIGNEKRAYDWFSGNTVPCRRFVEWPAKRLAPYFHA
jgi:hypothetical protein